MPLAPVESRLAAGDGGGDLAGHGYRHVLVGFAVQQAHGEADHFQAEIPGPGAQVRVPGNAAHSLAICSNVCAGICSGDVYGTNFMSTTAPMNVDTIIDNAAMVIRVITAEVTFFFSLKERNCTTTEEEKPARILVKKMNCRRSS
jgi:hypothetical protein